MKLLPASIRVFERGWLSSNNILPTGPGDSALAEVPALPVFEQTNRRFLRRAHLNLARSFFLSL